MPTGGIDPDLANQYVPIADLSFTLDGTTYSGSPSSGGPPPSPTQFQAQPTAHFQNGVFVGTNFAVVPVAGSGSGSTSGGGSTQHNVATVDGGGTPTASGAWASVSVVDTVAHFIDSQTFADVPKAVANVPVAMISIDYSKFDIGPTAAFHLIVRVTYLDQGGVQKTVQLEMDIAARATAQQFRDLTYNLLSDQFVVIKDGDKGLSIKGPLAGGKLQNLNINTAGTVSPPNYLGSAAGATYTNQ